MIETRVSLIERVRNHADHGAWSEFYAIYQPLLIAYIRKQGVSDHDAADIVQDVFMRLVPAMKGFELDAERGRFRSWLWRVTHNALADWARKHATRGRAEREWSLRFTRRDDMDSISDWNELYHRRIVEAVLEQVKNATHQATWLCFEGRIINGRPAAEIAAETGMSINAVYVNSSRVLARVREECAAFEEPLNRS